jgi:hypothetical protein
MKYLKYKFKIKKEVVKKKGPNAAQMANIAKFASIWFVERMLRVPVVFFIIS